MVVSMDNGVTFRRFRKEEKETVLEMISNMESTLDEQNPDITPGMVICGVIANILHIKENTAKELYTIVNGYGVDAFPKGVIYFTFPYVVEDPLRKGIITEILMYEDGSLTLYNY